MKTDPILHHYCQNISKGYLKDVVEMYNLLGFQIAHNPGENIGWIMIRQNGLKFNIQIAEVIDSPIEDINIKKQTHIGFVSDNPEEILSKIEQWANNKNYKFRRGEWSKIELFFDLPDIFNNFVVEVMHSSILES